MSNLEHYFENLLYDGKDVNGDLNKNSLTKEEQIAVEVCANYVLFTLFCGRDDLKEAIKPVRHGHWVDVNGDGSLWRCSACGETQCCDSDYCGEYGAKMDLPKPIIYPQVEGITPTVVKMDEVEE